ncbi:MAG: glycogen/starch/alpha-glucan phosphorylase [Anaerovoracaceae bacterium]
MKRIYTSTDFVWLIEEELLTNYGTIKGNATKHQIYRATCLVVRNILSESWLKNHGPNSDNSEKSVIYLSMEFLPGALLRNNIFNLGIEDALNQALDIYGYSLEELYEMEPDAGLGNGGLGRLASCFLDAIATKSMIGHGMSICYEYGIFKQKILNERQVEVPDDWLNLGNVWFIKKEDEIEEVHFGGQLNETWDEKGKLKIFHEGYTTVLAVPHDLLIPGHSSDVVNTLRLWKSESPISIDMDLFAKGKYLEAMEEKHRAEIISKILYPEDAHDEGKLLRMQQQYFFISASMQTLVKRHLKTNKTLDDFHEKYAIHINDTHPAMAIPELMRIFMDEYDYEWDDAWRIVTKTISYTNHTVMPEALEIWPEHLFSRLLPRIHSIVKEINRRISVDLLTTYPETEALRNEMAIIHDGQIRMANLCVAASHSVNGVSAIHSDIIKKKLFNGFYHIYPDRFTNVTNGIAYRRWLCQANPNLSNLIEELIGPGFKKNATELEKLMNYQMDHQVLDNLTKIKRNNKIRLANYIKEHNNITVNPDSIFDVQVKRFHEYKRQLLNLFHIMDLYNQIKENSNRELHPRTFIFGGKSAAGYYMAKQIISLACNLSKHIEKDPIVRDRIKIVFLENYSVSLSELIMPATEISEQISLAGKEASGTGNMKFMVNGAITIGTLDGANVEIHQAVGDENIFIFGMSADEVDELAAQGKYSPWSYYQENPNLFQIIKLMSDGINGITFKDIINSLITGYNSNADQYYVLADYKSYKNAHVRAEKAYMDKICWNKMSLANIAKSGIFTSDRSIMEYANNIWGIKPIK